MLMALRYVDLVLEFDTREELEQLIELYNPDILLDGGDWSGTMKEWDETL